MNVSLTPRLKNFVDQKVENGLYGSASEVIREALRLLQEVDTLKQLRKEIKIGLEQADSGELVPLNINKIKAEGRRHFSKKHVR